MKAQTVRSKRERFARKKIQPCAIICLQACFQRKSTMRSIFARTIAAGAIAAASFGTAMAGGDYYDGVSKSPSRIDRPADLDRMQTNSISNRAGTQVRTSRDNRLPFDGEGSYYEGVQRPQ